MNEGLMDENIRLFSDENKPILSTDFQSTPTKPRRLRRDYVVEYSWPFLRLCQRLR